MCETLLCAILEIVRTDCKSYMRKKNSSQKRLFLSQIEEYRSKFVSYNVYYFHATANDVDIVAKTVFFMYLKIHSRTFYSPAPNCVFLPCTQLSIVTSVRNDSMTLPITLAHIRCNMTSIGLSTPDLWSIWCHWVAIDGKERFPPRG